MRTRFLPAAVTVLVASLALAGCTPSGESGGEDAGGTLIVYTNSNSDGRGEWVTAEAVAREECRGPATCGGRG